MKYLIFFTSLIALSSCLGASEKEELEKKQKKLEREIRRLEEAASRLQFQRGYFGEVKELFTEADLLKKQLQALEVKLEKLHQPQENPTCP